MLEASITVAPERHDTLNSCTRFPVTCPSIGGGHGRGGDGTWDGLSIQYGECSTVSQVQCPYLSFSRIGETFHADSVLYVQYRTILARSWFILGYEGRTPREPRPLHIKPGGRGLPPTTRISTGDAAYYGTLSSSPQHFQDRKPIKTFQRAYCMCPACPACAQRAPRANKRHSNTILSPQSRTIGTERRFSGAWVCTAHLLRQTDRQLALPFEP